MTEPSAAITEAERRAYEPLSWPRKIVLALEVLAAYMQVRLWLRRKGLDAAVTRARAGSTIRRQAPVEAARVQALRLAYAVVRTLRVLPADSRCLMRSLVLTRLLGQRKIASTFVIGVQSGGTFAAHAWVEHRGEPVLPTDDTYGRLLEL